jgi:hypothetical protein
MSEHFATKRHGQHIQTKCEACGDSCGVRDQGLGRAYLAAWKTRHQHIDDAQSRPLAREGGRAARHEED